MELFKSSRSLFSTSVLAASFPHTDQTTTSHMLVFCHWQAWFTGKQNTLPNIQFSARESMNPLFINSICSLLHFKPYKERLGPSLLEMNVAYKFSFKFLDQDRYFASLSVLEGIWHICTLHVWKETATGWGIKSNQLKPQYLGRGILLLQCLFHDYSHSYSNR